jgi:hypothetical protein
MRPEIGPSPAPLPVRDCHRLRRAPRPSTVAVRRPRENAGAQADHGRPAAMRPAWTPYPPPHEADPIPVNSRTDRDHTGCPEGTPRPCAAIDQSRNTAAQFLRSVIESDGSLDKKPQALRSHPDRWDPEAGIRRIARSFGGPLEDRDHPGLGLAIRLRADGPPRGSLIIPPSKWNRSNCDHSSDWEHPMQPNGEFSTNPI